jgi:hypothetical protein
MQIKEGKSYRSRCGDLWHNAESLDNGRVFRLYNGAKEPEKQLILHIGPDGRAIGSATEDNPNDLVEEITSVPAPVAASTIYSHDRWNQMIEEIFDEVRHLAKAKGGEYSGDTDRLENFRRQGRDQELPMETIWRIYAGKHWDAVNQYIKDLRTGEERERLESINGRIRDLIVYLLLLEAMLDERNS